MYIKYNHELCNDSNKINLNLVKFGYAVADNNWKGKVVNPVCSRLYYVISGSAEIYFGDKVAELGEGKWYLLPAGLSFDYKCKTQMEHIYFHIKLNGSDGIDMLSASKEVLRYKYDAVNIDEIKNLIVKRGVLSALKLKQTVFEALIPILEENKLSLEKTKLSNSTKKSIEFIKANLSAGLNISQIAEFCFVSKSTISKSFKKELKISVHEFINQQLMFEAALLLETGDMSVLQVSEKLGFSDQFYFSRRFKQNFGITPSKYKKTGIIN